MSAAQPIELNQVFSVPICSTQEEVRSKHCGKRLANSTIQQQDDNDLQSLSSAFNDLQVTQSYKECQDSCSELEKLKFGYTVPLQVDPDQITCILDPSEELGGLYLGNFEAAQNTELLKKHKIRAVLTASIETGVKYAIEQIHFHEIIQAHDKENYDIIQHVDKAFDFIDRNRRYTNVLVHCFLGISRSASLVIAYLMKKDNMCLEKAIWKVKSLRRQINPNVGFVKQLAKYEKILEQNQYLMQQQVPLNQTPQIIPVMQMRMQPTNIPIMAPAVMPRQTYKVQRMMEYDPNAPTRQSTFPCQEQKVKQQPNQLFATKGSIQDINQSQNSQPQYSR